MAACVGIYVYWPNRYLCASGTFNHIHRLLRTSSNRVVETNGDEIVCNLLCNNLALCNWPLVYLRSAVVSTWRNYSSSMNELDELGR